MHSLICLPMHNCIIWLLQVLFEVFLIFSSQIWFCLCHYAWTASWHLNIWRMQLFVILILEALREGKHLEGKVVCATNSRWTMSKVDGSECETRFAASLALINVASIASKWLCTLPRLMPSAKETKQMCNISGKYFYRSQVSMRPKLCVRMSVTHSPNSLHEVV